MRLRYLPLALLAAVAAGTVARGSAEVQLRGTLHAITSDYFVLRSGSRLYSLRRERTPLVTAQALERNPRGPIEIWVPMRAIEGVRAAPVKPPLRAPARVKRPKSAGTRAGTR
jgi:hypothetical protein